MVSDPSSGTCYWTTERDGEVQLRMNKNSENVPPLTVPDMIMSAATKYSHYLAIGSKHKKNWQLLTYVEYYEACRRAAKAFLKVLLLRVRERAAPPPAQPCCVRDQSGPLRSALHFWLLICTGSVRSP